MYIDVIISADDIKEEKIRDKVVVIIDVLRATSVMITAINNGCNKVIPVIDVEDALDIAMEDKENNLLGGERDGIKLNEFDFSNSPLEYTKEAINGKNLIITTTNGTKAIKNSEGAYIILIAAIINGRKVAEKLSDLNKDVVFVNAGTYGQFSIDDFITSGYIINCMKDTLAAKNSDINLSDIAITAEYIYKSNPDIHSFVKNAAHYKRMQYLKYNRDLNYCFTKDIVDIVPIYNDGEIKINN